MNVTDYNFVFFAELILTSLVVSMLFRIFLRRFLTLDIVGSCRF